MGGRTGLECKMKLKIKNKKTETKIKPNIFRKHLPGSRTQPTYYFVFLEDP